MIWCDGDQVHIDICDDYLGFHRDQREDRMWVKTLKAGGEGGWFIYDGR